jgi:hypothetical protein
MAHTCDPSYSGDKDQGDHGSKPAQAKSSRDPISKKPVLQKTTGGVVQMVESLLSNHEALSSNPSTAKKKRDTK